MAPKGKKSASKKTAAPKPNSLKAAFSKAWSQADDFEKDLAKELEEPAEVPAEASKKRAADAGGPTAKRTPPAEEVAAMPEGGNIEDEPAEKVETAPPKDEVLLHERDNVGRSVRLFLTLPPPSPLFNSLLHPSQKQNARAGLRALSWKR